MRYRPEPKNQHNESSVMKRPLSTSFAQGARQRNFAPLCKVFVSAAVAIVGSFSAEAAFTYTFTPPSGAGDLGDLDHHNAYGWILSGLDTTKTITSASLTIKNINNWDLTKNMLFIHLFDTLNTAPTGGTISNPLYANIGSGNNIVTSWADENPNLSTVTNISDAFSGSGFLGTGLSINPLRDTTGTINTNNILLGTYVDGSYSGTLGTTAEGVVVPNFNGTFTPPAATQAANAAQTVTFNFNALQLQKLNEYISGGASGGDNGRIGFGFDSDCHFFNEGIEFKMISDVPPPAIPEPSATLAGLACLAPVLRSVFGRRRGTR